VKTFIDTIVLQKYALECVAVYEDVDNHALIINGDLVGHSRGNDDEFPLRHVHGRGMFGERCLGGV
jgi:hypothetical protein